MTPHDKLTNDDNTVHSFELGEIMEMVVLAMVVLPILEIQDLLFTTSDVTRKDIRPWREK